MKNDKEKIGSQKSVIRQLSFEVQALQEEASRLDLPDNIQNILMSWMKDAETLPDELEQKSLIIKHLGVALNYYRRGDMGTVRLSVLRTMKLFKNANFDKWVLGVEKQFGNNADGLRKYHCEVTYPKHQLWKTMADDIRRKVSRKMSDREVAKKIKEKLDVSDPEKSGAVNYIRKKIK